MSTSTVPNVAPVNPIATCAQPLLAIVPSVQAATWCKVMAHADVPLAFTKVMEIVWRLQPCVLRGSITTVKIIACNVELTVQNVRKTQDNVQPASQAIILMLLITSSVEIVHMKWDLSLHPNTA